eukprot:3477862-Amphidinium_carterae.1
MVPSGRAKWSAVVGHHGEGSVAVCESMQIQWLPADCPGGVRTMGVHLRYLGSAPTGTSAGRVGQEVSPEVAADLPAGGFTAAINPRTSAASCVKWFLFSAASTHSSSCRPGRALDNASAVAGWLAMDAICC